MAPAPAVRCLCSRPRRGRGGRRKRRGIARARAAGEDLSGRGGSRVVVRSVGDRDTVREAGEGPRVTREVGFASVVDRFKYLRDLNALASFNC